MTQDIRDAAVSLPALARSGAAAPRPAIRSSSSAPGRSALARRSISPCMDVPVVVLDDNDKVCLRLARDLLRQAPAGNPRPPRLRRPDGRQGRRLECRQGVLRRAPGLRIQPAARGGPQAPGLHQPAAISLRAVSGRPRPRTAGARQADRDLRGGNKVVGGRRRTDDGVALTVDTPDGRLHASRPTG